jgi:hypothetical protein
MAQQTAVEWLFEKMAQTPMTSWYEVREKALAMEKEQIIDAFDKGTIDDNIIGNEYYNETFVK